MNNAHAVNYTQPQQNTPKNIRGECHVQHNKSYLVKQIMSKFTRNMMPSKLEQLPNTGRFGSALWRFCYAL